MNSWLLKEPNKLETELQYDEHVTRIESMEKELNNKNKTLREINKFLSEIERLKRENEE